MIRCKKTIFFHLFVCLFACLPAIGGNCRDGNVGYVVVVVHT